MEMWSFFNVDFFPVWNGAKALREVGNNSADCETKLLWEDANQNQTLKKAKKVEHVKIKVKWEPIQPNLMVLNWAMEKQAILTYVLI